MAELSQSRRILVTGAAGFIGSHVVEALLHRGDTVVGLDNFDLFYDPAIKLRNSAWAMEQPCYTFIPGDLRDPAVLDWVFTGPSFDVVVHLAARAGVRPSLMAPIGYDLVNVAGTTAVLERVRSNDIPHLVMASSSSVYGGTSVPPFREDQVTDSPSSPYAATKRANEIAASAYHHLYGFSISALRFFTVYGPRQRPEMAIHKFARAIAAGEPVTVYGDGSSRRDYTFVADIVAGVLAAVDRPHGYRVYNLGTTATVRLDSLIAKLGDRLGREPVLHHQPFQDGDVPITHADISRAAAELGYCPTTSIDDGLDAFIAWLSPAPTQVSHLFEAPVLEGVA